ncbi:hypothetical protein MTYM_01691 [Methylococcales bacterium]|nr:hypothetical protein MTYM_01691 [Methylococcales bacterium]
MLDSVIAARFDRRMSSGKTKPCLLACMKTDGEEVELIAKFSAGTERGSMALAVEGIAAMLAADLALPIPEPYCVEVDAEFIQTITDPVIAELAKKSAPVAFGSKKLPAGFSTFPLDKSIPQGLIDQAADIFAFDALILNPDRRPENPNCLGNGSSFAIYDHELAFLKPLFWQPPWAIGSLRDLDNPSRHIFFNGLKGKPLNFERLWTAWEALTDERLSLYRNVLPAAWSNEGAAIAEILGYIAQLRDNIRPALTEVARVLQ